jgi:predicted dehydrogenase
VDKVRLGVLGAGNIAAMNVKGYLLDPRCEVAAVCDTDEAVGPTGGGGLGGGVLLSPTSTQMLDDPSLDAIEILTPTHLHHDHVWRRWSREARLGAEAGGQHH